MYTKGIIVELLWFLQGGTNIKYLVDNGCNIWNGDCYKKYKTYAENLEEPDYSVHIEDPSQNCTRILSIEEFVEKIKTDTKFSAKWGELGPTYGKQWRQWQGWLQTEDGIMGSLWYDQILRLINDLKTNPNSRRLIINAWNVAEVDKMTLPPCHYSFQCYTRELSTEERNAWLLTNRCGGNISVKHDWEDFELDQQNIPSRELSLSWNQRSCDFPLGIPFNIASYGFLLSILANEVNMVTGELIGNLGDCHIYLNQIEGVKEQIGREYTLGERLEFCTTEQKLFINGMGDMPLAIIWQLNHFGIPIKTREPYDLPTLNLKLKPSANSYYDFKPETWPISDFEIVGYKSHPSINFPLSN